MTDYDHDATLEFEYDDERRARLVERSIRPEVGEIDGDRSVTEVACDGPTLSVVVRATDLVALRAGLNTWLSLVTVAEETASKVE
jgi:KEOPS complex subunit Pcc1